MAGALCIVFYYLTVVILNVGSMAKVFQAQLSQLFFNILKTPRFWLVITLAPFIALLPDLYFKAYQNVFTPNPIEKIIRLRGKATPPTNGKPKTNGKPSPKKPPSKKQGVKKGQKVQPKPQ